MRAYSVGKLCAFNVRLNEWPDERHNEWNIKLYCNNGWRSIGVQRLWTGFLTITRSSRVSRVNWRSGRFNREMRTPRHRTERARSWWHVKLNKRTSSNGYCFAVDSRIRTTYSFGCYSYNVNLEGHLAGYLPNVSLPPRSGVNRDAGDAAHRSFLPSTDLNGPA
jgi:hypothetical protein